MITFVNFMALLTQWPVADSETAVTVFTVLSIAIEKSTIMAPHAKKCKFM